MAKKKKIPQDLLYMMAAADDDSNSDGAWQGILENTVDMYNDEHDTNFDSFDTFMSYVEWKN